MSGTRPAVRIAAALLFAGAAAGVVRRAVAERRSTTEAAAAIARLTSALAPLERAAGPLEIVWNGVAVRLTTTRTALDRDAMAAEVEASCGQDAETGGPELGTSDHPARRFLRVTTRREDAADGIASAVLCIFRDPDTGERFERWTLVRPAGGHAASATSLTRLSGAGGDLASMFPSEGDAPGGDLAGVPRPAGSRRLYAATIADSGSAVRMYELAGGNAEEAMRSFESGMARAGWSTSHAVAEATDDARLYVRGAERVVAAFERQPAGIRVLLRQGPI